MKFLLGEVTRFKTKESSLNTEIFFGRLSMLLIVSMYLYGISLIPYYIPRY